MTLVAWMGAGPLFLAYFGTHLLVF